MVHSVGKSERNYNYISFIKKLNTIDVSRLSVFPDEVLSEIFVELGCSD